MVRGRGRIGSKGGPGGESIMSDQYVPLPGTNRPAREGAQRLRDVHPDHRFEVTITLRGPELPDPGQMAARALNPQEFEAKYSASQADADKVAQVLQGYGMRVEEVSLPTRSMRVVGTAGQMEKAFQTKLGMYHDAEQGDYRGRDGHLEVQAELAGIVTGVFGLDQRKVARRRPIAHPSTAADTAAHASHS